jgi:hypothetical protein
VEGLLVKVFNVRVASPAKVKALVTENTIYLYLIKKF